MGLVFVDRERQGQSRLQSFELRAALLGCG